MISTTFIFTFMHKLPSNRKFGFLFSAVFALLTVYYAYRGATAAFVYGCILSSFFVAVVAVAIPRLLTPFNKAWMKLGDMMGKFVSPIVLGFFFFLLITPVALFTRIFKRDVLRLNKTCAIS